MTELLVVMEGEVIGRLVAGQAGRISFAYESPWLEAEHAHSLSISMPLSKITYPQRKVLPFLWNLLPDDPHVLQRWGQQYHVSPANPFSLLTHVGGDLPGALQLVPAEHLHEVQSGPITVEWLTENEVAERLRQLRADSAAVRRPGDIGTVSVPGVRAKTAFYWDEHAHRWGIPGGCTPTTHIIKPCPVGFAGLVENEHLCLDIAARLGLPAARTRVLQLDEPYLVVERYDRLPPQPDSSLMRRVHQENVCQALGLMPTRKCEVDGGPGIAAIVTLIRGVSSRPEADVDRFLEVNMLGWLIGDTGADVRNHSFLIGAADEIRLAPLHDVSSQLPYSDLTAQRLCMKVGDHHDVARVALADWRKVARACAVPEEHVQARLARIASELPDHITASRDQAIADGLSGVVVTRLAEQLIAHVAERSRIISSQGPPVPAA